MRLIMPSAADIKLDYWAAAGAATFDLLHPHAVTTKSSRR
jgi:hypothetical protein